MKIDTIVVGIDFSPESEVALAQAESIARKARARLVLVHAMGVTEEGLYMYSVADRPEEPWKRYVKKMLDDAQLRLEECAREVAARGIEVEQHLAAGFADEVLVDQARERGCDLLAVGTHGRRGVNRFTLGSVAERVTRTAPCHVLVARRTTPPEPPRSLLVPTDFSPTAELGVRLALAVAAPGARIELFHAWTPAYLGGGAYAPDWLSQDARARVEARARELVEKYRGEGVTLEFVLAEDESAPAIVEHIEQGRFDLVVMGSHGHRGLKRALLGSVAERVVRHAKLSVLVAHAGSA